jgi:hypothetical protein
MFDWMWTRDTEGAERLTVSAGAVLFVAGWVGAFAGYRGLSALWGMM